METYKNSANNFTKVLLVVYAGILCWILLFKLGVHFSYMNERSVNLVPFYDIVNNNGEGGMAEMLLNVLIFLPPGIYIGLLYTQWTYGKKVLLLFLTSLAFECIQFVCKTGAFDVTDIVTNTTGAAIGLYIFKAIEKLFNNSMRAQQCINILAAAGTIVLLILLTLLKMGMLPVRYQ
ncbi:VanZ family protein [Panacibacter sp. DH6]|uniref:VanZ family protein n=1 Tax=Panacibacter microcysteis TaxID=2793269 RepID=A0A931E6G6_9BACT|nr:VanZ family protein [Panacibacter microcysteis]MBG9374626.1 VanZ family protein [Panacibacter microcysteis]